MARRLVAQQAIFTWPVSSHGKQLVLDNRKPSSPQYLVVSIRGVSGLVAYNWETTGQMLRPLFEPVSHGGVPAPSDQHTERRFGGSRVFREGLTISEESYSDDAIDDFEVFADWGCRLRAVCRHRTPDEPAPERTGLPAGRGGSPRSISRWNANFSGPS